LAHWNEKIRNVSILEALYLGCGPFPVTVTTKIITFSVGEACKPLFTTVTGKGPNPTYVQHGLQIVATKRLSLASQRKERQDRRQSLGKHSKISYGLPMFLNGEEFPIT